LIFEESGNLFEKSIGDFIIYFVVFLFSLSLHEAAHAWTANRFGDYTGLYMGRVTLNPIAHIDLLGTIIFPIINFISGIPLIGWAKPVPVNPVHLRDMKKHHILVSLAGPGSNLLLATIFLVIIALMSLSWGAVVGVMGKTAFVPIGKLLLGGLMLNLALAVFNLIPIPPLDGHWVLYHLLPPSAADTFDQIRPWGFLLLYGLMLLGVLSLVFRPVFWVISSIGSVTELYYLVY
jgi:Zn-dependent protease